MSRRALLAVLGVLVFLVTSFGVARWLSRETDERGAVLGLLRAQARGDARSMLADLDGCSGDQRCRLLVQANARSLKRPGDVKILTYESNTKYALGDARGPVRVAWDIGTNGDTVVQCIDVRRSGIGFLGGSVALAGVSAPIAREGSCPGS